MAQKPINIKIENIESSYSIREVLIKEFGYTSSGLYKKFKKYIIDNDVDTTHFDNNYHQRQYSKSLIPPLEEYLSNTRRIKTHKLRLRLIDEKYKEHKCEGCQNKLWNNKPIPLELHHLDGNSENNNLNNLQILCPNCHHQTSNHGFRGNK